VIQPEGLCLPVRLTGAASRADQRSTHRAVALTSMGIATVNYLVMLFGGD
jgi:hypothetical protein